MEIVQEVFASTPAKFSDESVSNQQVLTYVSQVIATFIHSNMRIS